ncbi:alcohol dehydrogenase, propanol-preferring [Sporothrix schenckii 1099-18]|uniref:Enoyl reductase (ER) domain-containing protein n=2 Tax=Sporothrix schenckii TaxID=29908 RepID=U7Q008_SPOS1|nr:alcohol dehydrogenase, propanol-preferring [Sporothrix schenckii 1099-18]ERT01193.1 hypothetical protein HMPREF1624_02435 [Sporothrix schenckii ATCC 58251]KJR88335.1 alcohol dehydrogenase, propanol-preferring [Sporothrix schenckii 1099-18]
MTETRTQRAAVLVERGPNPKFEVRTVPVPTVGPNDVLVRLSVTSVCGSDYSLAVGHLGPSRNILGHEGVGRIVAFGSNATTLDSTLTIGQRIGLAWNRDACGLCVFCMDPNNDAETRCKARLVSGVAADGTFAEYAVVPVRYLLRLPAELDDVSDEDIVPIMCGGVTAYKAIKECGLLPGQIIAVVGVGGVGLLALMYAKAMGFRTIGIDVNAEKGVLAKTHAHVDHYVDLSSLPKLPDGAPTANPFWSSVGDAVKKLTPGEVGVHAVLVASGAPAAYQSAFGMLAPFGALMCVGIPPIDKPVLFHPTAFIANGWRVLGSAVGKRGDILEALDFVKRGLVKPLTKPARFSAIDQLVNDVGRGKVDGKYVIRLDDEEASDAAAPAVADPAAA